VKIVHEPNPLESRVEIDEDDRRILRLKLIIEDCQDRLGTAAFGLDEGRLDLDGVREAVAWDTWAGEAFDARIEERLRLVEQELAGIHVGDCTCQPCSCSKCWAESLLGIDTIEGLGKHQGHKISSAFSASLTPSFSQVIAGLEDYRPVRGNGWEKFPQEDFDRYIPRWTMEAYQAAAWLRDYAGRHFPQELQAEEFQE
jgi:hypothetical protein